jgi:aspartate kinase
VDGIYTTDPNILKEAKHLPEVSYQQIQEMAEAGAKVLNAQAVQFAKEAKIALYARSTFNPGKETIIRQITTKELAGVLAVVYEKEVIRIFVNNQSKIEWVINFFEEHQIPIKEFQFSGLGRDSAYQCSFITSVSNVHDWETDKEILQNKLRHDIYINDYLGTLSIIGEGFSRNSNVLKDILNLLGEKQIEIFGIGTTSFRISILVERDLLEEAVKICHDYWIS